MVKIDQTLRGWSVLVRNGDRRVCQGDQLSRRKIELVKRSFGLGIDNGQHLPTENSSND